MKLYISYLFTVTPTMILIQSSFYLYFLIKHIPKVPFTVSNPVSRVIYILLESCFSLDYMSTYLLIVSVFHNLNLTYRLFNSM